MNIPRRGEGLQTGVGCKGGKVSLYSSVGSG